MTTLTWILLALAAWAFVPLPLAVVVGRVLGGRDTEFDWSTAELEPLRVREAA